jgi:hypothetical protein
MESWKLSSEDDVLAFGSFQLAARIETESAVYIHEDYGR